jgi:glutamate/tyrosine decarboxylase-like PLP-dependent enzyme
MPDPSVRDLFAQAAALAADYRDSRATGRHSPLQTPAEALDAFRLPLPGTGEDAAAVIDDLARRAGPGLMSMTGPRFFGWVIGGSHPAGVAADILTSAWGQNAGNHHATPAAAAAEEVAGGWLLELLDLPRRASVGFVTGATMANFTCLAAARGEVLRRAGWDADAQGLFGAPEVRVLIGAEAHATVYMALQYLGFGRQRVVRVAADRLGRIQPGAFADTVGQGGGPTIAVLQAGQINTGAFDPAADLIPMAKRAGAWVHVDGAFGLWARAAPARKALAAGFEQADSWATDGHKWLQTPYDCGYAIVRDELAHRRAMTIAASYLPAREGDERDPSHFVPELSRRARGFATWALIRHLGRDGIAAMVERNCAVAGAMAERLAGMPGIEVPDPPVLNQFVVRFGDDDALTDATIRALQDDGRAFAGGGLWQGRRVMRVSVCGGQTGPAQVEPACRAIGDAWALVSAGRR